MSDEPTSSHAAAFSYDQEISDEISLAARLSQQRKLDRDAFNRMRALLLDDLIRNLDVLVYAQLSVIYYLDCYILRLLIRGMVQFLFLTPKPALFLAPPKPEPFVGAILGSNILCLILHIFSQAPSAGEATRFYLHGGLIIDFIGQKGPTSKLLLVSLDLVVVALQLVHLSAHVSRIKLLGGKPAHGERRAQATSTQDLDSEERGVRRSTEMAQEEVQEGIQLQALNQNGRAAATTNTADEPEVDEGRANSVLFDALKNGQVVLADLNVTKTVKEQIIRFHKTPPETRRNAYSAHLAGRMAGLRLLAGRTVND